MQDVKHQDVTEDPKQQKKAQNVNDLKTNAERNLVKTTKESGGQTCGNAKGTD